MEMEQLTYNNHPIQHQQHYQDNLYAEKPEKNLVKQEDDDVVEILYYQCQMCHEEVECNALEEHVATHSQTKSESTLTIPNSTANSSLFFNPSSVYASSPVNQIQHQPPPVVHNPQQHQQQPVSDELQKLANYVGQLQPRNQNHVPNVPTSTHFYRQQHPNANYNQTSGTGHVHPPEYYMWQQQQQQQSHSNYHHPQPNHNLQFRGPSVELRSSASTNSHYPSHLQPHHQHSNQHQHQVSRNLEPTYATPDPRQYNVYTPHPQAEQGQARMCSTSNATNSYYNNYGDCNARHNQIPTYVNNNTSNNYYNYNYSNNIQCSQPVKVVVNPNYPHASFAHNAQIRPPPPSYPVIENSYANNTDKLYYNNNPTNTPNAYRMHYPSQQNQNQPLLCSNPANSSSYNSTRVPDPEAQHQHHQASSSPFPQPVSSSSKVYLSNPSQISNYNPPNVFNEIHCSSAISSSPHSRSTNTPSKLNSSNPAKEIDFNPSSILNSHAQHASSPHSVTTEEAGSPDISYNAVEPEVKIQTYENVEMVCTSGSGPGYDSPLDFQGDVGGKNEEKRLQCLSEPELPAAPVMLCDGSITNVMSLVSTDSSNLLTYPCELCDEKFSSTLCLVTHVNSFHHCKLFQCEECGKAFEKKVGLRRHASRMHNPKKEYKKPKGAQKSNNRRSDNWVDDKLNNRPGGQKIQEQDNVPEGHFVFKFVCFSCQCVFPTSMDLNTHQLSCNMIP